MDGSGLRWRGAIAGGGEPSQAATAPPVGLAPNLHIFSSLKFSSAYKAAMVCFDLKTFSVFFAVVSSFETF